MSDDDKVVNIFTKKPEAESITYGHIEPAQVLQAAIDSGLQEVLVLGWDSEGAFYVASSDGYTPDLITMCEIAKTNFIAGYEA